jgi:potassium efflux system protein
MAACFGRRGSGPEHSRPDAEERPGKASQARRRPAGAGWLRRTSMELLRTRLASERKLLAVLDGPNGLAAGAPPGTDERALKQRHIRITFMVSTLVQHMADLEKLGETQQRRAAAEKELQAWTGLAEKPPYSILLADRLRADRQAASTELEGLRGRQELLRQTADDYRERLKQARQQLRQATEKAERARSEADQVQLAWQRETAALMGAPDGNRARPPGNPAATDRSRYRHRPAGSRPGPAQTGAGPPRRYASPRTDIAQVRAALTIERDALLAETDRTAHEYPRLHEAARAAREAGDALRAGGGRKGETQAQYLARIGRLEQDLELKQARLDLAGVHSEHLRDVLALIRARGVLWEARYEGHGKQDGRSRQLARETADKMLAYLSAQKKQLEQIRRSAGNRVSEIESRVENAGSPSHNSHLRDLQKIYGEHLGAIQRTLTALDVNLNLAQQMLVEFGGGNSQRSWAELRLDWRTIAAGYAAAFWNFELIAVEDTLEVDGKQVVGTRSVTIGKVLQALLLIVVGYALALYAARLLARMVMRFFGWQKAHADILRSWVLAIELMLLVVIVMFWVKIPLTVFAFLGGAVAIGLGFGMQTMMKNLISGLMVLGERPFRIGDMVEVGGIRGNVTNVGLRASTICPAKPHVPSGTATPPPQEILHTAPRATGSPIGACPNAYPLLHCLRLPTRCPHPNGFRASREDFCPTRETRLQDSPSATKKQRLQSSLVLTTSYANSFATPHLKLHAFQPIHRHSLNLHDLVRFASNFILLTSFPIVRFRQKKETYYSSVSPKQARQSDVAGKRGEG